MLPSVWYDTSIQLYFKEKNIEIHMLHFQGHPKCKIKKHIKNHDYPQSVIVDIIFKSLLLSSPAPAHQVDQTCRKLRVEDSDSGDVLYCQTEVHIWLELPDDAVELKDTNHFEVVIFRSVCTVEPIITACYQITSGGTINNELVFMNVLS